ncbi:epoxide hydrolase family protein [Amycolatopsis sp. NPDC059657]|uniref:epoxide hydrolase family protein n=1 Tax=Amycolatopsis sp. NPDC059657 TaxID=3346899 RepID=UPI00366E50B5
MTNEITPFHVTVDDADIADLRVRLARTRWPERETDSSQGAQLDRVQALAAYWADGYDFGFVKRLNAFPQFRTEIGGLGIHFVHVLSANPDARPLLITHGWPGSVVEFLKVLGPLSADFHVVAPSLPGFGWSDKPAETGWDVDRIARAWDELMTRLGYDRYGAQGGDWGATVTASLARQFPERIIGAHFTMAGVKLDDTTFDDATPSEIKALADLTRHRTTGSGYRALQDTRPQTPGYGLTDSPAGQLAWIAEKFWTWTDPDHPLTDEEILDDISVYWFTATAVSSSRICWESAGVDAREVAVPSGVTIFPHEIVRPSKRWAEKRFTDLRWYDEVPRGGHFAAYEQPELFVEQVRGFFSQVA